MQKEEQAKAQAKIKEQKAKMLAEE